MDIDRLLDPDESLEFVVRPEDDGERLDALIAAFAPWTSRTAVAQAIKNGAIDVDGKPELRPGRKLERGERITARLPKTKRDLLLADEELPALPLLHDGGDFIVVDKPAGLAAHPSGGEVKRTLLVAAGLAYRGRYELGGPWLPHRLDRDTSGASMIALTESAQRRFVAAFEARLIRRFYAARSARTAAAVATVPGDDWQTVDLALSSRPGKPVRVVVDPLGADARTRWRTVATSARLADLEIEPITGRQHQIRVHLEAIGLPILGDPLYGEAAADRLYLHAERLEIPAAVGGREIVVLSQKPWPDL